MSYDLAFLPSALKEWHKLGATVRDQFKKKLAERLSEPHADVLSGLPNCYKIKLRAAGYRLVYRVEEQRLTVVVVAVGKRERNAVYKAAAKRSIS
ncbi:MAG: type II toxin-antitoxin system RelE/ParE family toxin [Sphingomonas sp.]